MEGSETQLVRLEPPDFKDALAKKAEDYSQIAAIAEAVVKDLVVTNEEEAATAAGRAKECALTQKEIEKLRKSIVDPLGVVVRMVNGTLGPIHDRLEACRDAIKQKVGAFQDQVEAKAKEEREAAEKAAKADLALAEEVKEVDPVLAQALEDKATRSVSEARASETARTVHSTGPGFGSLSSRKVWKWRVTNLDAVPRSHVIVEPNRVMLNGLAKAQPRPPEIPGIEWFEERVLSGR